MEMLFSNIKPYLRFVRYIEINAATSYQPSVPYDARLFYTLDGFGTIRVGKKNYSMKRGSLLLINSGVEYHLMPCDTAATYIAINFDYTFTRFAEKRLVLPAKVSEFDPNRLVEHVTFIDSPEFNEVFYLENITSIEKNLVSMEKEYATKINTYELKLSAALINILVRCYRCKMSKSALAIEKDVANKIILYIAENYQNNLSNQIIAERFHYHPNYISNVIKQYTQLPLHQYIKQIRVSNAANNLLTTEKSITEIAALCGFYDASHFIKCFKDVMGMTPQQYRDGYQ